MLVRGWKGRYNGWVLSLDTKHSGPTSIITFPPPFFPDLGHFVAYDEHSALTPSQRISILSLHLTMALHVARQG